MRGFVRIFAAFCYGVLEQTNVYGLSDVQIESLKSMMKKEDLDALRNSENQNRAKFEQLKRYLIYRGFLDPNIPQNKTLMFLSQRARVKEQLQICMNSQQAIFTKCSDKKGVNSECLRQNKINSSECSNVRSCQDLNRLPP
jgi:hypothetical protein